MDNKSQPDKNLTCDACGKYGTYDFGGKHLCADCYEAKGSCCPEFGADDLWQFDEEPSPQREKQKDTINTPKR